MLKEVVFELQMKESVVSRILNRDHRLGQRVKGKRGVVWLQPTEREGAVLKKRDAWKVTGGAKV